MDFCWAAQSLQAAISTHEAIGHKGFGGATLRVLGAKHPGNPIGHGISNDTPTKTNKHDCLWKNSYLEDESPIRMVIFQLAASHVSLLQCNVQLWIFSKRFQHANIVNRIPSLREKQV